MKISRFDASSDLCNVCKYKNKYLILKVREWEFPSCKTLHDRDLNSALNIKKIALKILNTAGTAGRAYLLTGVGQGNE